MRQVRFVLRHYRKHLVEAYGKAEAEAIARETLERFEELLRTSPTSAVTRTAYTRNLYLTAVVLAMYRSLQARGATVQEAARLIYLGSGELLQQPPDPLAHALAGQADAGSEAPEAAENAAAISQQRRYPDDWVYEVVEGDGHDFEMGMDFTECRIVKYLEREGASELAPYLCWVDYPQFAAMGLRLDRTETLAQGGQRCDFRVSRGQPVHVEPEFLHA